jgi:hypothetical protein
MKARGRTKKIETAKKMAAGNLVAKVYLFTFGEEPGAF